MSRKHATVIVDDAGHATIRDEHSTNGTYVNGDRVLPGTAVRLADGDLVRLAGDVSGRGICCPGRSPTRHVAVGRALSRESRQDPR